MKIHAPNTQQQATELEIMSSTLPLAGSHILELGCGRAWMTRQIAQQFSSNSMVATETDRIQHEKNLLIDDLPGVSFVYGSAASIDLPDASVDVVIMLKSLHHVPIDLMNQAIQEIARVQKPGSLAYISEPVYSGDLNEIMSLFNDERVVRQAAFDAVKQAVKQEILELKEQIFFNSPGHYRNFEHFEQRMLNVTHTQHQIDATLYAKIKQAFMRHMTDDGADFLKPSRVDLLRRPTG